MQYTSDSRSSQKAAMLSVTESILIDRPSEDVFAFVGNYENDPQWRAGIFEMRHEPPGPARMGTQTREVMHFMGQETVNYAEVVEYEMGHKTAFKTTAGPLSARGYRLVEQAGEGTRFTYSAQADLSGLYKLLSPLMIWAFRRQVKGDLARLKGFLETGKMNVQARH